VTIDARRRAWGPLALAVVSGCLLAWGAFALLQYTDDADLPLFWLRLAVGLLVACATVWSAARGRWLLTTFLALACCITPVADRWTWAQLLCIALSIWALALYLGEVMHGRVRGH
jgi:hypothetical protein